MKPITDRAIATASKVYSSWQSTVNNRLVVMKWCLHDVSKASKATVPRSPESAAEQMTDALRGNGVFIRALKCPSSERELLSPSFIPGSISRYVVPSRKECSASLWVSGAKQNSYYHRPYLVFGDLSGRQVSKIADRDLLLAEHQARQFGPGYSENLSMAKEKLAEQIRARGCDVYVSGSFFVNSDVNESLITYGQSDVSGVGVPRLLDESETKTLEATVQSGVTEDTPEYVGQYIQAIALALQLEAVTGRPVPVVQRTNSDEFTIVKLSEELKEAIQRMPQSADYVASATVVMKMAVKMGVVAIAANAIV